MGFRPASNARNDLQEDTMQTETDARTIADSGSARPAYLVGLAG